VVVAAARILPMEQLQALLKFIEAGHPFVLMLASQMVITSSNREGRGGGGGVDQWKRDKKKKERTGKVTVSMVSAAAPAEQQQQTYQRQRQPRQCNMAGQGCREDYMLAGCELFRKLSLKKKLAKMLALLQAPERSRIVTPRGCLILEDARRAVAAGTMIIRACTGNWQVAVGSPATEILQGGFPHLHTAEKPCDGVCCNLANQATHRGDSGQDHNKLKINFKLIAPGHPEIQYRAASC
jgi:hypothetical protein